VGEKPNQPFQLSFNASLKVDFQGWRVTSAGGLILVRELDGHLGFRQLNGQRLTDPRRETNYGNRRKGQNALRQPPQRGRAGFALASKGPLAQDFGRKRSGNQESRLTLLRDNAVVRVWP
jgi:hypothetical protein